MEVLTSCTWSVGPLQNSGWSVAGLGICIRSCKGLQPQPAALLCHPPGVALIFQGQLFRCPHDAQVELGISMPKPSTSVGIPVVSQRANRRGCHPPVPLIQKSARQSLGWRPGEEPSHQFQLKMILHQSPRLGLLHRFHCRRLHVLGKQLLT